jgi:hypothetical protein
MEEDGSFPGALSRGSVDARATNIWMNVRLKPNLYRNLVEIPGYTDATLSSTP